MGAASGRIRLTGSVARYTSVTHKLRRLGRFDWDAAKVAVMLNRPTRIAVNFLDYILFRTAPHRSGPRLPLVQDRSFRISKGRAGLRCPTLVSVPGCQTTSCACPWKHRRVSPNGNEVLSTRTSGLTDET